MESAVKSPVESSVESEQARPRLEENPPWPDGARCAVVVTVNLDAELFWLRLDESCHERPKTLSMGEYGPKRGAPRMLDALDAAGVRASWMIPATVAERYPETVRNVAARGHEIGSRGDGLEDYATLDAEGQRRAIERSARVLEDISGRRPTGFRPPSAEIGDDTAGVLGELGFTWTSLARGDDRPTLLRPATGLGATPLVDVPAHWELNDFPRFMFNYGPAYPAGQVRIAGYRQTLDDWCAEFDAYHGYGLCCVITLEPSCIGKPGRIGVLEEFLAYMRRRRDVWFATGAEVARWWRSLDRPNDPGSSEEVRHRTDPQRAVAG
ncbi:polysaccharide deacetylase family protein [Streptomyces asiaticus]|uniref:polysaccharide deacetylase family protein n=1 Tax=Streptomyces asiaticus TaxID=114695 RepID=UPI003D74582C